MRETMYECSGCGDLQRHSEQNDVYGCHLCGARRVKVEYVPADDEAIERAHEALCRFVFPGCVVPRTEMVQAVVDALAGGDDWRAKLPARKRLSIVA